MRNKPTILLLLLLGLLAFSWGCGAGGQAAALPTGSVTVRVSWPQRDIPEATEYFTIDLFLPGRTTRSVPTTRLNYPQKEVTIGNIPVGENNLVVYARDLTGNKLAYASRIINIQAGDNSPAELDLQAGDGLWTVMKVSPYLSSSQQMGQRGGFGILPAATVECIVSAPEKLPAGNYTVTPPAGEVANPQELTDLGYGGAENVLHYYYGNPATLVGQAGLLSRGTGSSLQTSLSITDPELVPGDYVFDLNGVTKTINYDHNIPDQLNILSPKMNSARDLSQNILVEWEDLNNRQRIAPSYVYLVDVKFTYPGSSMGETSFASRWTSVDLRNLSLSNPQEIMSFLNSLSSEPSTVIPAGVFPPGSENIMVSVNAFAKNWVVINQSEGTVLIPQSSGFITINNRTWPAFKNNAGRTGQASQPGAAYEYLHWQYATGSQIYGSPVLDSEGNIYFVALNGHFYRLDSSGNFNWMRDLGLNSSSTPLVTGFPDPRIYVGAGDGNLYAFSPDSTLLWGYPTGEAIMSSAIEGIDGTILIGSTDGKLYGINPDGTLGWSFTTGAAVTSSAAIGADGSIFFGSWDGKLYALNPDGTSRGAGERWNYPTLNSIQTTPAISPDQLVIFGSNDGFLYALSPSGELEWSFEAGAPIRSSPAVDYNGYVYFGCDDGNLYCLFPNGVLNWNYQTGGQVQSSPALGSNGNIYFGSNDGKFYALDSGANLLWQIDTGAPIYTSPAIGSEGKIYFGANNGDLYAVGSLNPPPRIDGVDPASGMVGTTITITGSFFGAAQGSNKVFFFDQINAEAATSWCDTEIQIAVPDGAQTGPVYVEVDSLKSNQVNFPVAPN